MKILIVTDLAVETGRGAVSRFAHVLPELAARADVVVVGLGEADDLCREALERSAVTIHRLPFAMDGWKVRQLPSLVGRIAEICREERPDLVVLYWEIWDLMHALPRTLDGIPFMYMPHSMPFLDSMERPSRSFALDFVRRLATERRSFALRHMLTHVHQAGLLGTLPRIVINETVGFYLERYFPKAPTVRALPGYAIDLPSVRAAVSGRKHYDVAFMAKLIAGKGIFELLEAVHRLRVRRLDVRAVVIGSFEDEPTRLKFLALRKRYGLTDAVELAGWLAGAEKFRVLASARVFCCPTISNDTFNQCLLEALACGLPAVCYDMPYVRAVYGDAPAVRSVPFKDRQAMADGLDELLARADGGTAPVEFAKRYSSWPAAAVAEIQAYQAFLGRSRDVGAERPLASGG